MTMATPWAKMTEAQKQRTRDNAKRRRDANKDAVNAKQKASRLRYKAEGISFPSESRAVKNKARQERTQVFQEFARSLMTPCVDCGAFDVRFMDWHHRDPEDKLIAVSHLTSHYGHLERTMKKIKAEIAKCDCLCSNCHRIRHADERL